LRTKSGTEVGSVTAETERVGQRIAGASPPIPKLRSKHRVVADRWQLQLPLRHRNHTTCTCHQPRNSDRDNAGAAATPTTINYQHQLPSTSPKILRAAKRTTENPPTQPRQGPSSTASQANNPHQHSATATLISPQHQELITPHGKPSRKAARPQTHRYVLYPHHNDLYAQITTHNRIPTLNTAPKLLSYRRNPHRTQLSHRRNTAFASPISVNPASTSPKHFRIADFGERITEAQPPHRQFRGTQLPHHRNTFASPISANASPKHNLRIADFGEPSLRITETLSHRRFRGTQLPHHRNTLASLISVNPASASPKQFRIADSVNASPKHNLRIADYGEPSFRITKTLSHRRFR
jgi:hypothetical protein